MSYLTFARARRALASEETSCQELVSSFLGAIASRDDSINAFTFVDDEGARAQARHLDDARTRGVSLPLAGLVLGVKDLLCVKNTDTTCASRILSGFRPLFDATPIARLRKAGAIFIGKTNCDEFGMGSSNEQSCYGPVQHPHHKGFAPGGSSGGSAAAVAAGLCHAALGTDTGGSIRQPAAFCGVVGMKPTYGRVSRNGLVAYASSFDSVGTLSHTVEDTAIVLETMAGVDAMDATSAPVAVPRYAEMLNGELRGMRVGLPVEYYGEGLDPDIRTMLGNLVCALREAGAEIRPVALPHTEYGVATYYILATAEASSNLARFDGIRYGRRHAGKQHVDIGQVYARSRTEGFGPEVKRRIMLGTYVLSSGYYDAYYSKAQRVRSLIRQDFDTAFEDADVLLTPVTPTPGFRLGSMVDDPLKMYLSDLYTVSANLAGLPGLVIPIGTHPGPDALPVGAQFLARPFEEARLLRIGQVAMELVAG